MRIPPFFLALVPFSVVMAGSVLAQQPAAPAPVAPPAASAPASQPALEPKALEILKATCEYVSKLQNFTFEAEIEIDHVLDNGQALEFTNLVKYSVRRPDHIAIFDEGEAPRGALYFDGKTLTLFNRVKEVWASAPMPGNLDNMMKRCAAEYNIVLPVGDLIFAKPYEVLTQNLQTGIYVGQAPKRGAEAHHLAFTTPALNWQIWVDAGDKPLPRKVIVDFKNLPGHPRFSAEIGNWKLDADLPDSAFVFTPAKGVEKVELYTATQKVVEPDETPKPATAK